MKTFVAILLLSVCANAQEPTQGKRVLMGIIGALGHNNYNEVADGEQRRRINEQNYKGNLSSNPYNQNSTGNPYGQYGSPYSSQSINNPNGIGTPYVDNHLKIYDKNGEFRGNLNNNPYDPNSVANPYGKYGSQYSPDSINNPHGAGSPYKKDSPTNPYGSGVEIYQGDQ